MHTNLIEPDDLLGPFQPSPFYDSMILWFYDSMILWFYDSMILWHDIPVDLNDVGITPVKVPRCK